MLCLSDATVGFVNSSVAVTEGEELEVCLQLTNVPSEGLACAISVSLIAEPYIPGKQGLSCVMYSL